MLKIHQLFFRTYITIFFAILITLSLIIYFWAKSFYLNQFGMVNINSKDEINNSDFIFSVKKKGNKIYLEAKKGVKWKELTFILPKDKTKPVIINDSNMVSE